MLSGWKAYRVHITLASIVLGAVAVLAAWGVLRRQSQKPAPRQPGFRDATEESGIDFRMSFLPDEQGQTFKVNLYDHGCGVAVADYDSDGRDDVLFLNQLGGNALYRNRGDGTFVNATAAAGPVELADRICVGAAFGDFDNDGDQDLYITSTRGGNVLLENLGQGRFEDVSERAGVACVAHSQTPTFFDYDNDGWLDLFVTNTARWTSGRMHDTAPYYPGDGDLWDHVANVRDREYNLLYHNNGDGTFDDVTASAGMEGQGWGGDVAVFDYDEDGWLDVFVTNMFGRSQLYHNDGGTFRDVTGETLRRTSLGAIGSKAFDYDNDGQFDLFIADMHSDMWFRPRAKALLQPGKKFPYLLGPEVETVPEQRQAEEEIVSRLKIDYEKVVFGNCLFHNEGGGHFSEVSDAAGMETFWPWGVADGDFDNDGFVDAFLPSGMGYPYFYYRSSLMLNRGDGTLCDRASAEGIEPPRGGRFQAEKIGGRDAARSSRCAATADFDLDGRLDLVVNNFNDRPYYFRNQFPKLHYIAFRLRGTRSNRDAVGAVVKLILGSEVMVRQVQASGGYLSQSSKTLHFGLRDRTSIDRAEIRWPSGRRQVVAAPAIDRLHEITEPTGESLD